MRGAKTHTLAHNEHKILKHMGRDASRPYTNPISNEHTTGTAGRYFPVIVDLMFL